MFKKCWRESDNRICFHIGNSDIPCLKCGDINSGIESGSGTMLCEDCHNQEREDEDYWMCPSCGRRYWNGEAEWVDDTSEYICSSCASSETFLCEDCEGRYWNSNRVVDSNGAWLCERCYEDRVNEEDC